MRKTLSFIYGVFCYVVFILSFLYAVGFLGNLIVSKSIDAGDESNLGLSLIIKIMLLGVFAVQHTIMARPTFKRCWTKALTKQAAVMNLISSSPFPFFDFR